MYEKYIVKKEDTLKSIANNFKINEEELLNINNIPFPDLIRAGLEIIVPNNKDLYFDEYTINKGDNLYKIARSYNINPELLAVLNGLNMDDYIYPNQKILIPKSGYSYYITKSGDTLFMGNNENFNKKI